MTKQAKDTPSIFRHGRPQKFGLYDPQFEKDACGVGFIAHIKGTPSHDIVTNALTMLHRMDHRGACGCEANTGDGAGIMTGLPKEFLQQAAAAAGITLTPDQIYGVGIVFLPTDPALREKCKTRIEGFIIDEGQKPLGWRDVPQDNSMIGDSAKTVEPKMEMLFVGAADGLDADALERKLFVIRKYATRKLRTQKALGDQHLYFYVCSLSTKVIIYKGQLTSEQVPHYFPDLRDPNFKSHLAMVHSRFSTNTFPSWDRAQPFRFMSHNGEINTLRGNVNALHAREGVMQSKLFGDDLKKLFPIIEPDLSDSGTFDNCLELLLHAGRTLPEAAMMMIPEPWENHEQMAADKRAFYEFHACKQEPWDGPASVVFTDGKTIGATLDRNGLRPSRYYVTHDDVVIMASEVGVVPVDPANVKLKGRLQPGRMFLVNFEEGRIVPDEEIKNACAKAHPYEQWLENQLVHLDQIAIEHEAHGFDPETLMPRMKAFGFSTETMQHMLIPLVHAKKDPIGSMGNDAALACLSDKPRMLYDYFKQLFAQVTNPPIDSIREEIVMSLRCYIGPEGNLLDTQESDCHRIIMPHPILSNEWLASLKHLDQSGWKTKTIDITYPRENAEARRGKAVTECIKKICDETSQAIRDGYSVVILSDRRTDADRVPLSSLLATAAVHHHLVKRTERTRIGIVLETGEAREVHHHCLLIGFGADAINPYLAFESLWQSRVDGLLGATFTDDETVVDAYRTGVGKGMLKVMAKMGISTLHSYKGAQIFEAVGLAEEVMNLCFVGAASRLKGIGFDVLAEESLRRHEQAYPTRDTVSTNVLENDGQIYWRAGGEKHTWKPEAVASLQVAARTNNRDAYKTFAANCDLEARETCTLRGLLNFKPLSSGPVPLEDVEPASEIVKRFCTGAMSFGSISAESHETLAIALNRLGGKSNTGEGGEDPIRFVRMENGDSKRSAIKQVASGRFGVTIWYLNNADEIQIKIVQGAKPGEGGELPGHKVDDTIARIRHSTPGVGLISPPPHHDIYSIEDLKQLIHDLKNANPRARISVKLVSEIGVGTVAAGVAKGFADHILIAGDVGGTGASPLTSVKHAGMPWELGIAETHQTLVLNDLRSRVVLQTDGGLKTGRDVVIAALLGAEEMGFSTAPLIALGCIMMRKCHLNTCPVGIATQDPVLRKKFKGKPEHVVNYLFMVAEHAREIMAELGFTSILDMVGRADVLEANKAVQHWKSKGIDLSPMLINASEARPEAGVTCTQKQDHGLEDILDRRLIEQAAPALTSGQAVEINEPVINTDRAVGTMLSFEIANHHGEAALPDDTIKIKLTGSAGQTLGGFLSQGVTIELEGDANDYVGKGLSGGRIIIYPPKASTFKAEDNIIAGNVALYGAVRGKAFFRGIGAERFCVRNSGATTCIEGVGDHACEYMTGGRAVILGSVGRNFAAGMSGGIAYVWDPIDALKINCNTQTVDLDPVEDAADIAELIAIITEHHACTGSTVAAHVLENFDTLLPQFVKVMPTDYKRVLAEQKRHNQNVADPRPEAELETVNG
ncbi:MAG: glutamate synthase (NADPH/NADH) large chain [Candidatus Promineifilaceae bacterium]|jgi:glutamate synthase (NADPH) large chain